MSFVALYTFSKSIDDASSFNGLGGSVVQNPLDLAAERGLSTFDQRHCFSLTYTLSSPVGIHGFWRNGDWKTKAFSGWTLNGNFSANSGMPLTALAAGNLTNSKGNGAVGQLRADATGQSIDAGNYPYFNLLAFTAASSGPIWKRRRRYHPRHLHYSPQRLSQSRLALRRSRPRNTPTTPLRQQRTESRADHQFRHDGQLRNLWTCHRRQRHANGHANPEVQLLMPRVLKVLWGQAFRPAAGLPPGAPLSSAAATIVAAAALSLAQQPPLQDTGVKFTAEANLVIVDVTVKDQDRQPIEGLKASDFTVLEDRQAAKDLHLRISEARRRTRSARAAAHARRSASLTRRSQDDHHLPSRNQIQYHDKRLLVLFFDFSNMGIPEQLRAQDAALNYINTQMTESDLMAILLTPPPCRSRPISPPTATN